MVIHVIELLLMFTLPKLSSIQGRANQVPLVLQLLRAVTVQVTSLVCSAVSQANLLTLWYQPVLETVPMLALSSTMFRNMSLKASQ